MPNKTLQAVTQLHRMIANLEEIEDTAEKDNWELSAYISSVRGCVNEYMAMVGKLLNPKDTLVQAEERVEANFIGHT